MVGREGSEVTGAVFPARAAVSKDDEINRWLIMLTFSF